MSDAQLRLYRSSKNKMKLHELEKFKTDNKAKRVGRGRGSGKGGHTVGRGQKGQKARKGAKPNLGFEGGQSPLYKKLPKIGGFNNPSFKRVQIVSLKVFSKFKDGEDVTPKDLVDKKILKELSPMGVKIMSSGELTKKINLSGFKYSEKAKEKIESFGAKINA